MINLVQMEGKLAYAGCRSQSHDVKTSFKHELRAPLNLILGYSEALMTEAAELGLQAWRPDLERIHSAGCRLLGLVNDLFDSGRARPYTQNPALLEEELRTPLNQIIGYAGILEEEAQERGHLSVTVDLQKIRRAARELLQLVLGNFLSNEGQTGGMRCSSASGAVEAPLSSPGPVAFRPGVAQGAPAAGSLLVADDDPSNRDVLARRLRRLGYTVAVAENGRRALEELRAAQFDLLLLDIDMPELNGYEVLERLKADPHLREVPVIVLSASSQTNRIVRCIELGAEDHLTNPFDPVVLQARVGACLEQRRLRDREVSYLRQIEQEKKRSDDLLRIILPQDVAEELKATGLVKPRRFNHVAVLFCDIVGFTAYSEQHPPEQIVEHLQRLVQALENIASSNGLEKIKTIGDAFMAVSGLAIPPHGAAQAGMDEGAVSLAALRAVRAGLEMIATARELPPHWQVRVGVHVGPVVAGVVGRKKYQYDVWGDAVNTAARMEQSAAPGTLCVNEQTWDIIAPWCLGSARGTIPIKGKGKQRLFHVERMSDETEVREAGGFEEKQSGQRAVG